MTPNAVLTRLKSLFRRIDAFPATFAQTWRERRWRGIATPPRIVLAAAILLLAIFATLDHCRGNKRQCAEMLGVSLKTLYNRLAAYHAADATRTAQ